MQFLMNMKGVTELALEVSAVVILLVGSGDFSLFEGSGENACVAEL